MQEVKRKATIESLLMRCFIPQYLYDNASFIKPVRGIEHATILNLKFSDLDTILVWSRDWSNMAVIWNFCSLKKQICTKRLSLGDLLSKYDA